MRHMLGNLSPNYFERTKRYMMLRASRQGTDLTVSGTPPLSLPNSLGKPLKAWEVDVVPYQDGTGDPSPSNVRPIHGTDKLTITTAGSNLFDKNATDTSNGYLANRYIAKAGNAAESTNYDISEYISVLPSTTYTLSPTTGSNPSVVYYDEAKTYIDGTEYYSQQTVTFTTPSNAKFIRCSIPHINIDTFCLNYGSTATPYTPYIAPSQTVLTLPQTVYTGTIGSDGGESNKAYALLNDPDKWIDRGTSTITFQYNQEFLDRRIYAGSYEGLMCTYYPVDSSLTNVARWRGAASYYFGIKTDSLTLDQIKADAAAGKIAICYDLATPTTFAVPSVTIPTPTGTATTWATAEDGTVDGMEVTYVGKA